MNSRARMLEIDRMIDAGCDHAGVIDRMFVGGREVLGHYEDEFVESESGEISVAGTYHSFDCSAEDLEGLDLAADDPIEVRGWGEFRFLRAQPGNAGRVVIVLGKRL